MDKYLDKNFVKNIKPKLVRDNIPDIIVNQNKRCTFSKVPKEDIQKVRFNKVLEELNELKDSIESNNSLDEIEMEMADFIEIYCFWLHNCYDDSCIERIKNNIKLKQSTNGSFNNNYYLEKVEFIEN